MPKEKPAYSITMFTVAGKGYTLIRRTLDGTYFRLCPAGDHRAFLRYRDEAQLDFVREYNAYLNHAKERKLYSLERYLEKHLTAKDALIVREINEKIRVDALAWWGECSAEMKSFISPNGSLHKSLTAREIEGLYTTHVLMF